MTRGRRGWWERWLWLKSGSGGGGGGVSPSPCCRRGIRSDADGALVMQRLRHEPTLIKSVSVAFVLQAGAVSL